MPACPTILALLAVIAGCAHQPSPSDLPTSGPSESAPDESKVNGASVAVDTAPSNDDNNASAAAESEPPPESRVDNLRRVIDEGESELKRCFEEFGKLEEGGGTLDLQITIVTDGSVSAVDVKQSGVNAAMESCVRETMSTWRFQAAKDDLSVRKKYHFTYEE